MWFKPFGKLGYRGKSRYSIWRWIEIYFIFGCLQIELRGDQLIPSHYKNLVVRFMNHNGALSWIICFWHSKLFSIMTILFQLNSSEVGKSKKNSKQKIWRRHYPTYWPITFRTFQINILQVQIVNVQGLLPRLISRTSIWGIVKNFRKIFEISNF